MHHLADAETLFVWWLKFALAESGRIYTQNWPTDNDNIAASFQHAKRPIASSIAIVRATRIHITQLIPSVPDAWERYTQDQDGNKTTFRELFELLARHTLEHVDEITELRHKYNR